MDIITPKRKISFHKILLSIIATMSMILAMIVVFPSSSYSDDNPSINVPYPNSGSSYWQTSTIREWLNSDSSSVNYTDYPPNTAELGGWSYSSESGFLTNFTENERDAIEVVKRKNPTPIEYTSINDGGSGQTASPNTYTPFIDYSISNLNSNISYQVLNDKVFLLSFNEINNYAAKRGISLSKTLTQSEKQKLNTSNSRYSYYTSNVYSSSTDGKTTVFLYQSNDRVNRTEPYNANGIVPAIVLNKDFITSNSVKVSNLQFADEVTFGSYAGEPIQWEVINKFSDGSALLWAKNILSVKPYNVKGKSSISRYSNVSFDNYDLDLTGGLGLTGNNNNYTLPNFHIENLSDYQSKQNGSWTLTVKADDPTFGIKRIIMPDGSSVYSDEASILVDKNSYYFFKAENNNGIYSNLSVPVGNITPDADVSITSSSDGWTNNNVNVNISVNTDIPVRTWPEIIANNRDFYPPTNRTYPNSVSYAGKSFRISGTVELTDYSETMSAPMSSVVTRIGFYQTRVGSTLNGYLTARSTVYLKSFNLSDIYLNPTDFDFVGSVPTDFFTDLDVFLQTEVPFTDAGKYHIKWSNIRYELLDQDDLKVQSIILPNGDTVTDVNSYTDVLTEEGEYEYTVIDNRGKETSKTITVQIDKTKPTLTITGNPTDWVNNPVTLNVTGNDGDSGIKRIQKPNGEWQDGDNLTYSVAQNGSYKFIVEDNAGNQASQTVVVNKIDNITPTGVTAIAGNQSATITWVKPSNQGSEITNYTVTSNPDNKTCSTNSSNDTTCVVTGLTNGKDYNFTVVATNDAGVGSSSQPSNYIIPTTVPDAPSNISVISGNKEVSVSWSPSLNNGGATITGYTVTSNPDNKTCSTTGDTLNPPATSCVVSGLTNGTQYTFTVKAKNSAGYSTESSPSSSITPMTTPAAPENIQITPSNKKIAATWDLFDDGGSPIDTYKVVLNPGNVEKVVTQKSVTFENLTNGVAYTITVSAHNIVGYGSSIISNEATPATTPSSPSNILIEENGTETTISWDEPIDDGGSEITGYTATAKPGNKTCSTSSKDETSCVISGLNPNSTYSYFVVANNLLGSSVPEILLGETPPSNDNGQVNTTVDSSISLTLDSNDNTVNLTGIPGLEDVINPDNTISYIVATNNLSGYSVNVKSDTENLIGNILNNSDKISFNILKVMQNDGIGVGSEEFALGTQNQNLYSQSSKSNTADGDRMTSLFKVTEIPWVNADDYTGTVTYTATAN